MKEEAVGFFIGFLVFGYSVGLLQPLPSEGTFKPVSFGQVDATTMLWMGILSFLFSVILFSNIGETVVAAVTAGITYAVLIMLHLGLNDLGAAVALFSRLYPDAILPWMVYTVGSSSGGIIGVSLSRLFRENGSHVTRRVF